MEHRFARLLLALPLVSLVIAMAGCATPEPRAYSGYLKDYSRLTPHPTLENAMVYRKPGLNFADYDKFVVNPLSVHFAPDAEGQTVSVGTLQKLTDYFHDKLVSELAARYQIADRPGSGVMVLNIAITDVKKAAPMLNVHPATKMSGVGLGAASVEAEGLDGRTGERVWAFVHTRPGDRLSIAEGLSDWGAAQSAMDFWVNRLIARIDQDHLYRQPTATAPRQ